MKTYANAIIAVVVLLLIGATVYAIQSYGDKRYQSGKDEVQKLRDKDKADRKAEADKQAAETLNTDKGNEDALRKNQADLHDARRNLDIALKRLRDLPFMPGDGYLPLAGSECSKETVPSVASDTGGVLVGIEQRIGSCEGSGSEPCFVSRAFFDRSLIDAQDRGFTRQWAAGQGIKTVSQGSE